MCTHKHSDRYHDEFVGAVQVEFDTDKNSCDHHGNDHCACHTDDHVFLGDTWLLLPACRVATHFRLKHLSSSRQSNPTCNKCNHLKIFSNIQYDQKLLWRAIRRTDSQRVINTTLMKYKVNAYIFWRQTRDNIYRRNVTVKSLYVIKLHRQTLPALTT